MNYCARYYEDYIFAHTPKQVAEDFGWKFTREMYQEFYHRRKYIYPDFVPERYYNKIPTDRYFQRIAKTCDIPFDEIKLGFIGKCAFTYACKRGFEETNYDGRNPPTD